MTSEMPKPKFQVGDRVLWQGRNRKYFEGLYLRSLVRHWRLNQRRLNDGGKNIIRKVMKVVRQATTVEIAGTVAHAMHGLNYAGCNQCYIGGVPGASSPAYFHYQLLIRWNEDGNTLAMITGIGVATDRDLKKV